MKNVLKFSKLATTLFIFLTVGLASSASAATKDFQDAVGRYLDASNAKQTTIATLVQTYKSMNLPIKDIEGMSSEIINKIWPNYIADVADIMSKYYTLGEINDITAFYETPVGKKFARNSPEITQQLTSIMSQPEYLNKIQEIVMKYIQIK